MLVDPEVGVHIVEVAAFPIGQVHAIEPGGTLQVRYGSVVRRRYAINKVRSAMFDVKDATARAFAGTPSLRFDYCAAFPSIRREEWLARFGRDGFCPREFLSTEDLERSARLRSFRATDRTLDSSAPIAPWRANASPLAASPPYRTRFELGIDLGGFGSTATCP